VQPILVVHCVACEDEPFNFGWRINELIGYETPEVMFDSGEDYVEDKHVQQLHDLLRELYAGASWQLARLPCGTQAIALGGSKRKRHRAARLALALSVRMKSGGHGSHIRNESESDPLENVFSRVKKISSDLMAYLSRMPSSERPTKRMQFVETMRDAATQSTTTECGNNARCDTLQVLFRRYVRGACLPSPTDIQTQLDKMLACAGIISLTNTRTKSSWIENVARLAGACVKSERYEKKEIIDKLHRASAALACKTDLIRNATDRRHNRSIMIRARPAQRFIFVFSRSIHAFIHNRAEECIWSTLLDKCFAEEDNGIRGTRIGEIAANMTACEAERAAIMKSLETLLDF
jgi:hypothetical protein